jgi:hypothetical protein
MRKISLLLLLICLFVATAVGQSGLSVSYWCDDKTVHVYVFGAVGDVYVGIIDLGKMVVPKPGEQFAAHYTGEVVAAPTYRGSVQNIVLKRPEKSGRIFAFYKTGAIDTKGLVRDLKCP